ncbi:MULTISPECIES: TetR/AcrR family transcriptional regulator [Pseudomonas]|uniref:TetR/AcrR family transcriptional regulator n=1 Tax=Pseudomonas TaxID=286 RepID=UPI000B7EDC77|nr:MULTISPECIES: TetR/AcrR family transcriptional regulator [Pseudomonas]
MHESQLPPATDADDTPGQPARRGRPVGNHEEKRTELLKAVIEVIAKEGYAGTSMRRVAQHAGCTTGAVTYYFANKEEMVTAAAQGLFDEFDTLLDFSKEQVDVRAIIEEWLNWTKADEPDSLLALFQLLAHARHERAFADVIQQRYFRFRKVFTAILARGQEEGIIRDDIDADLLADQISAMGDGWMLAMPIEPDRFTPERKQALLDAVIVLISPPQAKKTKATAKAKRSATR